MTIFTIFIFILMGYTYNLGPAYHGGEAGKVVEDIKSFETKKQSFSEPKNDTKDELKALKDKAGNIGKFKVSKLFRSKCASCHGVNGNGIIGPKLYGQRGYVIKGQEHAKGSKKGDLKEFYHIGNPISNDSPENIWPIEINKFQEITSKAFLQLEEIGLQVLESIALYLDLENNYFVDKVKGGQSIMRAIHYYPINPDDVSDGAVRAAAHGDINFITLLMGASADGLEILTRDNRWSPINSKTDQLVINVGDMLERLTNNKLMSTVHRVVNPSRDLLNTSRYSIPFFLHPKAEMDLSCLENCIDDNNPKSFDDISAGKFLEERLKDIGLKK